MLRKIWNNYNKYKVLTTTWRKSFQRGLFFFLLSIQFWVWKLLLWYSTQTSLSEILRTWEQAWLISMLVLLPLVSSQRPRLLAFRAEIVPLCVCVCVKMIKCHAEMSSLTLRSWEEGSIIWNARAKWSLWSILGGMRWRAKRSFSEMYGKISNMQMNDQSRETDTSCNHSSIGWMQVKVTKWIMRGEMGICTFYHQHDT